MKQIDHEMQKEPFRPQNSPTGKCEPHPLLLPLSPLSRLSPFRPSRTVIDIRQDTHDALREGPERDALLQKMEMLFDHSIGMAKHRYACEKRPCKKRKRNSKSNPAEFKRDVILRRAC